MSLDSFDLWFSSRTAPRTGCRPQAFALAGFFEPLFAELVRIFDQVACGAEMPKWFAIDGQRCQLKLVSYRQSNIISDYKIFWNTLRDNLADAAYVQNVFTGRERSAIG